MLLGSRRKIGQCLLRLVRLQSDQTREFCVSSRIFCSKAQAVGIDQDGQSEETSENETKLNDWTHSNDHDIGHSSNHWTENNLNNDIKEFYRNLVPKPKLKEQRFPQRDTAAQGIDSHGYTKGNRFRKSNDFNRNGDRGVGFGQHRHQSQEGRQYGDISVGFGQLRDRKNDFRVGSDRRNEIRQFGGKLAYIYDSDNSSFTRTDSQSWSHRAETDKLPKDFQKNFYLEHPNTAGRSEAEVKEFLAQHDIRTLGKDIPKPILMLEEANFPEVVSDNFTEEGFTEPTAIQSVTWPIVSSGKDCIGIAQTGSGKTLAYTLPAITHILNQPKLGHSDGPIAFILAPTRELVQQIVGVTNTYAKACGIRVGAAYGGASRAIQIANLRDCHMCVATPGRLLDFLDSGIVRMNRCTYVVLDEADRMLDMGFEPQVRNIMDRTTPERQTVMWSATWPEEVQDLAADFLTDCAQVNVGSKELTINRNITHDIRIVSPHQAFFCLEDILADLDESSKVLIFTETKRDADRLANDLTKGMRSNIDALHGDKSQMMRDRILSNFKSGKKKLLVATDVASRGIDVNDITHIINYNFPRQIDSYVHRIGRTGRAGKTGVAISFLHSNDMFANSSENIRDLIKLLQDAGQEVNPALVQMMGYYGGSRKSRINRRYGNDNENFSQQSGFSYRKKGRFQDNSRFPSSRGQSKGYDDDDYW